MKLFAFLQGARRALVNLTGSFSIATRTDRISANLRNLFGTINIINIFPALGQFGPLRVL